jgi:nucleotide-binding universal stress UspA family protein
LTKVARILLVSEKPPFSDEVVAEAVRLARELDGRVSILQLMKIWGSGLGLPHPGLKPNRQEQQAARDSLVAVEAELRRQRVEITGKRMLGTRNPAKVILREAARLGSDVIVMADKPGGPVRNLLIANEPRRVARKATMRVHLVGRG